MDIGEGLPSWGAVAIFLLLVTLAGMVVAGFWNSRKGGG
jgi:hypothetical protein